MARHGQPRTRLSGIPRPLQPLVGGLVLIASVRIVDALWRRSTGRPVPSAAPEAGASAAGSAAEARAVRDRVVHAFLLGAAMRVARRSGLPRGDTGR